MKAIVVGTGRCGSTSLHQFLRGAGVDAHMEPQAKELVGAARIRVQCGRGLDDEANAADWIAQQNVWGNCFDVPSFDSAVIVDNNLSLFVDLVCGTVVRDGLSCGDSDVRVIWLIRSAWDCVASLMMWRWYRDPDELAPDDVFGHNRIQGPWTGEIEQREWDVLSKLGKCAWYWSWLNRQIARQLEAVDPERQMRVCLEDWVVNADRTAAAVCEFLGVERPADRRLPVANTSAESGWPAERPAWTPQERVMLWRFCGQEMKRWYPDWPEPA